MWPSSAPAPKPPRNRRSPATTAPPTPVPIVSMTMSLTIRPAPKRNSAQPAALASLSTTTALPTRASSFSRNGSLRQSMFGA